jgi:hypothetical protein
MVPDIEKGEVLLDLRGKGSMQKPGQLMAGLAENV